jgi:hypothetical protein
MACITGCSPDTQPCPGACIKYTWRGFPLIGVAFGGGVALIVGNAPTLIRERKMIQPRITTMIMTRIRVIQERKRGGIFNFMGEAIFSGL